MIEKIRELLIQLDETKAELIKQVKSIKSSDKITAHYEDGVVIINVFDGPVYHTTSIIEPGFILRYNGTRLLTRKQRENIVKELGL